MIQDEQPVDHQGGGRQGQACMACIAIRKTQHRVGNSKKVWRRGDLYKTYKIINSLGDAPQSRSIEKYYKKSGKLRADPSEVAERRVRHFASWLEWRGRVQGTSPRENTNKYQVRH